LLLSFSEIVVHEFEEKGMSFFFEIPNFLQNPKHSLIFEAGMKGGTLFVVFCYCCCFN
jgi:hypothetical protein